MWEGVERNQFEGKVQLGEPKREINKCWKQLLWGTKAVIEFGCHVRRAYLYKIKGPACPASTVTWQACALHPPHTHLSTVSFTVDSQMQITPIRNTDSHTLYTNNHVQMYTWLCNSWEKGGTVLCKKGHLTFRILLPSSLSVTLWHSFMHVWFWHSSSLPQDLLQEKGAAAWQSNGLTWKKSRRGPDISGRQPPDISKAFIKWTFKSSDYLGITQLFIYNGKHC